MEGKLSYVVVCAVDVLLLRKKMERMMSWERLFSITVVFLLLLLLEGKMKNVVTGDSFARFVSILSSFPQGIQLLHLGYMSLSYSNWLTGGWKRGYEFWFQFSQVQWVVGLSLWVWESCMSEVCISISWWQKLILSSFRPTAVRMTIWKRWWMSLDASIVCE